MEPSKQPSPEKPNKSIEDKIREAQRQNEEMTRRCEEALASVRKKLEEAKARGSKGSKVFEKLYQVYEERLDGITAMDEILNWAIEDLSGSGEEEQVGEPPKEGSQEEPPRDEGESSRTTKKRKVSAVRDFPSGCGRQRANAEGEAAQEEEEKDSPHKDEEYIIRRAAYLIHACIYFYVVCFVVVKTLSGYC